VVVALPGHRSVVAATNYKAREFGIRSVMPITEACRRYPGAVYLHPNIAKYSRVSKEIFQILDTISDHTRRQSRIGRRGQ
jgi:DNA polymerase-4